MGILELIEGGQPDAVRHAWHTVWEDGEVILAAGKKDKKAMRHAGGRAWNNKDFVMVTVKNDWREIKNASEEVRGDREIAKEAIRQNPEALMYVSESLKEDPEVVYFTYQKDENVAMQYARPEVFEEREFVLAVAGIRVPPEWVAGA